MPYYIYQSPDLTQIKEIFQHMNDIHEYYEKDIKWTRIYTIPHSSIDTKIDPWSNKDFIKATNKKGSFGTISDISAELSEKRGGKEDPIKKKYYENYSKRRNGVIHPDKLQESSINNLRKMGVSVTE